MASVAVLHPKDCLSPFPKPDLGRTNQAPVRHGRRRRSPTKSQNTSPPPRPAKTLVLGEVKLLRRGEELKATAPKSPPADKPSNSGASRTESNRRVVAPSRDRVARQNRAPPAQPVQAEVPPKKAAAAELASCYAGFAFITSPPPSSLPVPAFCSKKTESVGCVAATTDLRKLLRLE